MLDEEVIIKTPKHTGERFLIINVVLMLGVSALFFGGTAEFGLGLIIAMGILAPINIIVFKSVWIDAPAHTGKFYLLFLSPYLAALVITILGLFEPSVHEVVLNARTYYSLDMSLASLLTSASPNALVPISQELCTISIVGCALSIYFVTDSRYIVRTVLMYCGLIAVFFALIGGVYDIFRSLNDIAQLPIFGAHSFSTFPDKFHWTAFAIVWMGGFLAMGAYTGQRYKIKHYIYSLRFICIAGAAVLFASAYYCGTPMQRSAACGIFGASMALWAIDTLPTLKNLNRHFMQRSWSAPKKRFIRGGLPMYVYSAISAAMLWVCFSTLATSVQNPAEKFLSNAEDAYSISVYERKALLVNSVDIASKKTVFGWGTASYPMVFAFNQGSDFGDSPWLSPRSDLLKKIIENGIVGLVLSLITPLTLLIIWLVRFDFSFSSAIMLATAAVCTLFGVLDFPFESPAVYLSVWVLMMSAFSWDRAETR